MKLMFTKKYIKSKSNGISSYDKCYKNEAENMKRIENNGNYYREELADASVR